MSRLISETASLLTINGFSMSVPVNKDPSVASIIRIDDSTTAFTTISFDEMGVFIAKLFTATAFGVLNNMRPEEYTGLPFM